MLFRSEFRYIKNIAEALNISIPTVKRSIASLKKINAFDKVEKVNTGNETEFRNKYFFTPLNEKFILVSNDIFESGLTSDEIGFLIRAKAKAFNNGMTLKGNKEKLASFIGVSLGKFNKLFNSLVSKGFIAYETSLLTITCNLFKDTSKKEVRKLKQINMWSDMAHDVLINRTDSKEAKIITYYFIDKKEPVTNPVSLIKKIITGVKNNGLKTKNNNIYLN